MNAHPVFTNVVINVHFLSVDEVIYGEELSGTVEVGWSDLSRKEFC